jgi:DNA-binding CsgD family transcriptional regulator
VATEGVVVEADAAQRARDLGDAEEERAALMRVEFLVERVRAAAATERPVEEAYLATAEAHATRAQGRPSPERWAATAERWTELGRRYRAAGARFREAEARAAAGDREGAAEVSRGALDEAREMGAIWLAGEIEGLMARARLRAPEAAEPVTAQAATAADNGDDNPFDLTPRERQVLALVARGETNREIGNTLFMAEKTASVHVSRILSKLGVRSRTEAAALAHRHGLE